MVQSEMKIATRIIENNIVCAMSRGKNDLKGL